MIKRIFFSFLCGTGVTRLVAWWNRKRVTILCYHGVSPRPELIPHDPWKMHIRRDLFGAHLDHLLKRYRVITLGEFLKARRENRELPPYSVVLTFDDGIRNFFTAAAPELAARRLPATMFVVIDKTDRMSAQQGAQEPARSWTPKDDRVYLSWAEMGLLAREQGIEFGSHTYSHPRLVELSQEEAERELKDSYDAVRARTGSDAVPFSYPHGQVNAELAALTASLGYSCGLFIEEGGNAAGANAYALRRTFVNADDGPAIFAARVAGLTAWVNRLRAIFSPVARRVRTQGEARTLALKRPVPASYPPHKDRT